MQPAVRRFVVIGRAIGGVIAGLCFGFIFCFLTARAGWRKPTMLLSDGLVAVAAAGFAVRYAYLRGFSFIAGLFSGVAVSIVAFWTLLFWVVIGSIGI